MRRKSIKNDEQIKILTLCEYLFFDQYRDYARFLRFEKCFQPLFNNVNISLEKVFKDICGPKKKYITYKRFKNAYLKHIIGKDVSKDTNIFFDKLFNSILKTEKSFIGKNTENAYSFSTIKSCRKRECITLIEILINKEGKINGINLEYDGFFRSKMYPKNIEDDLDIGLEMNLGIIDENEENMGKISKMNQGDYRDGITHVFGTINEETGYITFLGFKCISGKISFEGFPDGDGFLFGLFGTKFHDLKIQLTEEGIVRLEPRFKTSLRKNYFLNVILEKKSSENLDEDEIIKDEEYLMKLKDVDDIDKLITTSILDDDLFFNSKLKDNICGKDYKEVIDQYPRNWILRSDSTKKIEKNYTALSLSDTLMKYKKEYEKEYEYRVLSKIKSNMKINENTPQIIDTKTKNEDGTKENKDYHKIRSLLTFQPLKIEGICLHKIKKFKPIPKIRTSKTVSYGLELITRQKKWNGIIDEETTPNLFFNKENYQDLKSKLGNVIHEEIMEKNDDIVQQDILNEIVPCPGRYQKINKDNNNVINFNKKQIKLKMKNLKGEINYIGEEKLYKNKLKAMPNKFEEKDNKNNQKLKDNIIYSDATQFWNNLTGLKGNSSKEGYDNENNHGLNNYINSLSRSSNYYTKLDSNILQKLPQPFEPDKIRIAQQKWKLFRHGLEKINGIYLLQTIGSVLKAIHVLGNQLDISLTEKIKLYQMLDENENIIDFLTQQPKEFEDEEEEDDNLMPDEHPERNFALYELQEDLNNIKQLLKSNEIKDEVKKKLKKLYNLYFQQKNILIENETKLGKEKLISKISLNINKYFQQEQEKRRKAKEEQQKQIDEEQKKLEKSKKIKSQITKSILSRKVSTKIYHNQKIPKAFEIWTDNIFPSVKKSLCPFNKEGWILPQNALVDDVTGWENVSWCRVDEIKDFDDYDVFVDGATIDDIEQGNIGDCYFFSTVGSLCAYPDFFNKLFHIKEKSDEHIYGVYLYLNGKWKLVLVDDYFPYKGEVFKQFYFSCSAQNEIWVPLIEKAWAKVNGCYARIGCGGYCSEAFDVLTEAYTEHIFIIKKKKEEVWKKIENSFSKKYVMTAGTSSDNANLKLDKIGLCIGHAYTLMNIYKINTKSGEERLVKLRNPWGNNEFNGAWGHYSKKWTPEIKKQCDYEGENDEGIFYMSYNDFIKYFVVLDIAKIEPGYKTTYLKIKKEEAIKCQIIKFNINEEIKNTFIQLYQKNPRILRKDGTHYPNTVMSFIMLVKFDDNQFKYVNSMADNEMHIAIEEDLTPGTYFLFCDVYDRYINDYNKSLGYAITCYSKVPIVMENVTKRMDVILSLQLSIYDYCKQKIKDPIRHKRGLEVYLSKNFNKELPFKVACFVNLTKHPIKVKLGVKSKNKKSFCIYNDDVATEFDTSVIKEIESGFTKSILVLGYSRLSKFEINYHILSKKDKRTQENTHPIFETDGEQIDEKGHLFSYILKVENDKGYIIGLENISNIKYKLRLKLEGLRDIDAEFIGKKNPEFEISPNSKKVFNLLINFESDVCSFDFEFV